MREEATAANRIGAAGPCRDCGRDHALPEGDAREHAEQLMERLVSTGRLDDQVPEAEADPRLSLAHLYSDERGHNMFGVLECRDALGRSVVLRAFSSLRGVRAVRGWAPPIVGADSPAATEEVAAVRELSRALDRSEPGTPTHRALMHERRRRSRVLLHALHERSILVNARGESRSLRAAYHRPGETRRRGLPGGVGSCCAPKLLTHAAKRGLRPVGIAEFHWGAGAGGRRSGAFYPPCETRCRPILGFLLCGLDEAGDVG